MANETSIPPLEQMWWDILLTGDYKVSVKQDKIKESDVSPELKEFVENTFQKSPEMPFPEFDAVLKTKFAAKSAEVKKQIFTHLALFQTTWQGMEKTRKKESEKISQYLETALNWPETKKLPDLATGYLELISSVPLSKEFPALLSHLQTQVEIWETRVIDIETILNSLKAFLPSKEILTPFFEWTVSFNLVLNRCNKKLKEFAGMQNEFLEEAQIWGNVREIVGEPFKLNKIPKVLERDSIIVQIYQNAKELPATKGGNQVFSLKEFLPVLKTKYPDQGKLVVEIVYVLYLMGILVVAESRRYATKSEKREIKDALEALLLPFYAKLVKFLFPATNLPSAATVDQIKKLLPPALEANQKELETTPTAQSVAETTKTYSSGIDKIALKMDALGAFLTKCQELIGPEIIIFPALTQLHAYLQDDLRRKEGEFIDYVKNVENESQKGELQEKISGIIKDLENSLQTYEEKTRQLLKEKFQQLQEVEVELKQFEKKYLETVQQVASLIRQYGDERHVNIYSVLKNWEGYLTDFQKKMKFTASNLFTSLADRFKPLLEQERELNEKIQGIELNPSNIETPSQWLTPVNLSHAENRQRIKSIDQRLKEMDTLREHLLRERLGIEKYLAGTIQSEEKIETKQCVVCHKNINFAEDQFIKCPSCNRAAHYLCLAWWLEKHNNCVVCGAEYVIPDNYTYPDDEEQSSGEEDNPAPPNEE